jgi:hypothetical protein
MLIRSVDNDSQRHMAWCISAPISSAAHPHSGLPGIEYRWDKITESIPNIQSNISIRWTAFKGTTLRGEILRQCPPLPVVHFRVFLFLSRSLHYVNMHPKPAYHLFDLPHWTMSMEVSRPSFVDLHRRQRGWLK